MCGSWCLGVHLECIGEGKDYSFLADDIEMKPCGNGCYRYPVKIPTGTIKTDDCGKLYTVAVTLTSKDPCDDPGRIRVFCKEGSGPHQGLLQGRIRAASGSSARKDV